MSDATEVETKLAARIDAMDAKNSELLGELKEAKAALKGFKGIDPDKYRDLQDAAEESEAADAKRKGDWEKREKQLVTKHDRKVDELQAVIADQNSRFAGSRKEAEALSAIGKFHGNENLLKLNVMNALQTDDDYNVYADVDGKRLTAEAYVKTLAEDTTYAGAFPGTGMSGGGSEVSTILKIGGEDPLAGLNVIE